MPFDEQRADGPNEQASEPEIGGVRPRIVFDTDGAEVFESPDAVHDGHAAEPLVQCQGDILGLVGFRVRRLFPERRNVRILRSLFLALVIFLLLGRVEDDVGPDAFGRRGFRLSFSFARRSGDLMEELGRETQVRFWKTGSEERWDPSFRSASELSVILGVDKLWDHSQRRGLTLGVIRSGAFKTESSEARLTLWSSPFGRSGNPSEDAADARKRRSDGGRERSFHFVASIPN
ncbi:hypothetical protein BDK51DRAFT_50357 [Blyttiomyces helicus]|uniref:Uncharacterized protein n=1 Tax=Blyttiomyces helicus TaxID=388810 RepID=A0A4P9VXL5_9FUNG|nr:hypothetical protein BDK51DRAFT_50357 [Blyttiomyces helicus]|eukprot:RKO83028.1 hypothetical protein BDK51DRAFT_50357 [Blyttiomyces helicus]